MEVSPTAWYDGTTRRYNTQKDYCNNTIIQIYTHNQDASEELYSYLSALSCTLFTLCRAQQYTKYPHPTPYNTQISDFARTINARVHTLTHTHTYTVVTRHTYR